MRILILVTALAIVIFNSCSNQESTMKNDKMDDAFPISYMDTSISPCENFNQYAIGGWKKNNPVPETESRWSSFNILFEENNERLKVILENLQGKSFEKGSTEQLVGDFYTAALDSIVIEDRGMEPLFPLMKKIDDLTDINQLPELFADLGQYSSPEPFGFYVGQDDKNSTAYIAHLYQGGLGLPDKDYYLSDDEKSSQLKKDYGQLLTQLFELAKIEDAEKSAKIVLEIETMMAESHMSRQDRRIPELTYNKYTLKDFDDECKNFNWQRMFVSMDVKGIDEIIISQPEYFKKFDELLSTVPLHHWKLYMKARLIRSFAPHLNRDFELAHFDFYGRKMRGTQTMKPRWKRAMSTTNRRMGQPLGKLFVDEHFDASSKQHIEQMVENLRSAYKQRIQNLDWMSDETKEQAMVKLASFGYKIGYPNKWKDYSSVNIVPDNPVANIMAVNKFEFRYMVDKLGKPVDRDEWHMTPQMVNAYYSSSMNEIVFPAGILQPPFYNPNADDAMNYGGIGAVIGHEFTHGFDDQGSKFNGEGNLKSWWTSEDSTRFVERTNVIVEQFNNYEVLDSVFVNGRLTLGENIADFGGLTMAYYALEESLKGKDMPEDINGFNYRQRFFLGWANVWKMNTTEAELRRRIITDSHSPGTYRVIGPLSNMPEFHEAFGCFEKDEMYRSESERAKVW